jgi:CBS domain-containing protein
MKVSEVMTRNVKSVRPRDPVKDVVILICTNHISGVTVVDHEGRLIGIISEKDIIRAMYPNYSEYYDDPVRTRDFEETEGRYEALLARKVEELMSRDVFTTTPGTPMLAAASLMLRKKIRRLPVVEDGKIIGIVSQGDIHQAIFKKKLIR